MRFLAWGCGVQSTTLGEMSAQGILEPLDAVITADTGWERQATYDMRDFYAERWREMGLRVEIAQGMDIRNQGAAEYFHIPFFTESGGPLRRQCTKYFKLIPCRRKMREIAGFHRSEPPHPRPGAFEVWLGISLDEWVRAKRNPPKYQRERWPLLERRITRGDCVAWLESQGLPVPVKSACVCCPYRRASEWIEMRDQAPQEFLDAIAFDEANRHTLWTDRDGGDADRIYVYNRAEPLATADLEADAKRERRRYGVQIPMMLCESGYCWV